MSLVGSRAAVNSGNSFSASESLVTLIKAVVRRFLGFLPPFLDKNILLRFIKCLQVIHHVIAARSGLVYSIFF